MRKKFHNSTKKELKLYLSFNVSYSEKRNNHLSIFIYLIKILIDIYFQAITNTLIP